MGRLRVFFLLTDISFIIYWLVSALHLIPAQYLYKDYDNPILVGWNWSFVPLDLAISATGLTSVWLYVAKNSVWQKMALVSLVLTFCSGLQALSFWFIRADFDPLWWLANGYLLVYPLFFLPRLFRTPTATTPART